MSHFSHFSDSTLIVDQSLADSETQSLKNSMKYHVKYGSTGDNYKNMQNYRYLTHLVEPTDTLQGLSLRYNVSMEQIKRANKLWSSDSLSLRSRTNLNIPIIMEETIIESPNYSSSNTSSSQNSSPKQCQRNSRSHSSITANNSSLESDDIPLDDEESTSSRHESIQTDRHESKLRNGFKMASLLVSSSLQESNDLENHDNNEGIDESAADFLIRIDSSIAKSKDKVKVMQQNRISGTHSDDDLFRSHHSSHRSALRRHHSSHNSCHNTAQRPHSANSSSSLNDIQTDFSQPLVMMTSNRKVLSSMKRLERAQDEIFEL